MLHYCEFGVVYLVKIVFMSAVFVTLDLADNGSLGRHTGLEFKPSSDGS